VSESREVGSLYTEAVISIMVGCVALSFVRVGELLAPDWNGLYVVIGCVLVSLEASYSLRLIQARTMISHDSRFKFRVVEIALILILLKLASYVGQPWNRVSEDIRRWGREPLSLLTLETAVAWTFVLVSWGVTTSTLLDIKTMQLAPRYRIGQRNPVETITTKYFVGGMLLMFAAGLSRMGLAFLLGTDYPPTRGLTALVLAYFLLGLTILGQLRSRRLREQWKSQRVHVDSEVARRWVRYSLFAIGISAVLSFVLPTSYTSGVLQIAATVIAFLLRGILLVGQALFYVLGLVLWLLAAVSSLLRGNRAVPPSIDTLPAGQIPSSVASSPAWLAAIRTALFWVVAVAVAMYVIRTYLHDHPGVLQGSPLRKLLQALLGLITRLWRGGLSIGQAARSALAHLPRSRRRKGPSPRELTLSLLRRLSPRGRIQAYYLSIVRRAGRYGAPRQLAQTPSEYADVLSARLPEVNEEVSDMTNAFVVARYSTFPVRRADVTNVRALWKKLRTALIRLRGHKPTKT